MNKEPKELMSKKEMEQYRKENRNYCDPLSFVHRKLKQTNNKID